MCACVCVCKAFLKFAAFQGTAKPAPVQGTCWMRRPTTRYRRRRPRPRPAVGLQRRCPFVYRSRGPSLQTAQTASDGVGRPPEPRSLCPSCRLLPGLPRNPGSPRLRHAQPGTHHGVAPHGPPASGVAPHVPPASDVAPGIRLENKRWSKPKTYRAKRHVAWVLSNEWLFFLISSWFSKLHLKTMKWHKEATE